MLDAVVDSSVKREIGFRDAVELRDEISYSREQMEEVIRRVREDYHLL